MAVFLLRPNRSNFMDEKVFSTGGRSLPLGIRLLISALGIAVAGLGMSNFLRGGTMGIVFFPIVLGALMVYISGYDRKYFIDKEGIWRDNVFWGQHRPEVIRWSEIADVRLIADKGNSIYLISHAVRSVWPLTFALTQKEEVLRTIKSVLSDEDIVVEE